MKNFHIVCFFILALVQSLIASPFDYSPETIPLSSSLYADMDTLYLLSGLSPASSARPWSKSEAAIIFDRVDEASLSSYGRKLYDHVARIIEPGLRWQFSDTFGLGVGAEVNLEMYAHSDGDEFTTDEDWLYGADDRMPLLKGYLDFGMSDFFYLSMDLRLAVSRVTTSDALKQVPSTGVGAIVPPNSNVQFVDWSGIFSRGFDTNLIGGGKSVDLQWPKRAVAAIGGKRWNVTLSKDRLQWGNGLSGNFLIGNHVDAHNFFRASVFSDHFKFEWTNLFFETSLSPHEAKSESLRMLMAHRFEFRPWGWMSFVISDAVMFGGDFLELSFINPAYIFHNLYNRDMLNAIVCAELSFAVYPGVNLYGQFVMDQAQSVGEGDWEADAYGFLAGVEYLMVLGPGTFEIAVEYAQTSPSLYRRDTVDFLMFRKYYVSAQIGSIPVFDYIGYRYGGDAQVLQADFRYHMVGYGKVGLSVIGLRHGEMDLFAVHNTDGSNTNTSNIQGPPPSGDIINESLIVSVTGEYEIPRLFNWMDMSVWTRIDWIGRRTYARPAKTYGDEISDWQCTLGIKVSI